MRALFITIIGMIALLTQVANAYVTSSTNYKIERDSINFGGTRSTSTNYGIEDTAGEVASGGGTSTSYTLKAGYQQIDASISITVAPDVTLLPAIASLVGGTADGTASWTVTTDSTAGYTLTVKADTSPTLKSGANSFANYTPAGSNPDFTWSVTSSAGEFGFTPEGTDIKSTYKDDGSVCASGSADAVAVCWDSITTSEKTVSQSTSSNSPSGTLTLLRFKAEAGASALQAVGTYTAIITVTATAL